MISITKRLGSDEDELRFPSWKYKNIRHWYSVRLNRLKVLFIGWWLLVSSARQSSNDIIINNSDNNKSLNLFSSLLNAFLIKKESVRVESGERWKVEVEIVCWQALFVQQNCGWNAKEWEFSRKFKVRTVAREK